MEKNSLLAGLVFGLIVLGVIALLVGLERGYQPGSTGRLRCDSCIVYTTTGPVATGHVVHMPEEDMAKGACAALTGCHPDFVGIRRFPCTVPDSVGQERPDED